MAITSPGITMAMPELFGNIKPALSVLRRLGATDFSSDAPMFGVKPGMTLKTPVSGIEAAAAYDDDDNNYFTGGDTEWATLTATHYLKGFDISGVNVDQGIDAGRMKQLFSTRAGSGIGAACLANARSALDGATLSTAVVLPAAADVGDYQTLGADLAWLDRSTSVLVMNGTEYAALKRAFANEHIVGTDAELAAFVGFKDLVCLQGLTARAVIVPDGSFGTMGRVPAVLAEYREAGTQTDEDTGLSVGILVANDQEHNRIVCNADLWFGSTVISSAAGATTPGVVKVGTAAAK